MRLKISPEIFRQTGGSFSDYLEIPNDGVGSFLIHQVPAVIKAEIRNNVSAKRALPGKAVKPILTRPTGG
jgi:ABC-type uncharacterized transport system YnjBCD ATPase subunit